MFDTILIANRGEIAARVIETAGAMGLRTVAVFSDADAGARHVALADEAVRLGPPDPAASYLDMEAVIAAARETGAGAIHPGYGFLSENPDFVEMVEAAGLVFVGPSAKAIRAMGLKDAAKRLMAEAGVPVVPGYHGDDQEPGHLEVEASTIGYPVLIKAVAGGGGKGMRRVDRPEDFIDALESAKAEARTAFGNDAVLIEKFVQKPRHIEVQVFGDGTRAVHLFERDCSLQRRHQKVIEEAPAPGMTEAMRNAMGDAAVRAAEAVGYSGAGTVEFIVDASDGLRPDGFWFMEMNTRLQVEHPVTEEITGVDLVRWQIEVAQGKPFPARQEELSITGHAIEARIYAEDAAAGFLPATGTLAHLAFRQDARIDTGVRQGDTITPHYDPMIAKLTVHGATRDEALARLHRALDDTHVAGTVTNLDFLGRLARHEAFVAGDLDTGIIDRAGDTLTAASPVSDVALALGAVMALDLDGVEDRGPAQGFTLWGALRHQVTLGDRTVWVTPTAHGGRVDLGQRAVDVALRDGEVWIDGAKTRLSAVRLADAVQIFGPGGGRLTLFDPLARGGDAAAEGRLEAPMPGRVTAVFVGPGDAVTEGQRLLTLEAMKMEHSLRAPRDGTVAEILAAAGDQVDAGQPLARLEEAAE